MRTPYGLMILQPNNYKINLGNEIQIPVLIHEWIVNDLRTLTVIFQALSDKLD